jgi:hypothetical protein
MNENEIPERVAAKLLGLVGVYDDHETMERVHYNNEGERMVIGTVHAIDVLVKRQDPRSTGISPWGTFRDLPR